AQTIQGRDETVVPLDQQLTRGVSDLAPLVGLDLVHLVGERGVVARSSLRLRKDVDPLQEPTAVRHCSQFSLQDLSDGIQGRLLCSGPSSAATAVPNHRRTTRSRNSLGNHGSRRGYPGQNTRHPGQDARGFGGGG